MRVGILGSLVLLVAIATRIQAQAKCGSGKLCPEESPCCSQYGECGTGAYCLGGCDPANSYELGSCMPAPSCRPQSWSFDVNTSMDSVVPNTKYLGDPAQVDWVSAGQPLWYNQQLMLTLPEGSVGTLVSSAAYLWYGKVTARLKTSGGAGVVTAFILYADSKDEIDFEFVGSELDSSQTSYYSQGRPAGSVQTTNVSSNTLENTHDYEIDWKPDMLTWSIDGRVVRTLSREETWNATYNMYSYPQTPARVQFSLWPAGDSADKATVDWAGGPVDWNSQYMGEGYYYALVDQVSIECYDPPSSVNRQGSKSYTYDSNFMTNDTVAITDRDTVIASFCSTGTDPDKDDCSSDNDITLPIPTSGTVTLADAPTGTGAGTGSTGFVQGNDGTSSSSGLSTGAKAGTGVGVVGGVIVAAAIIFFVLRRRRQSGERTLCGNSKHPADNSEKPEMPAEYDSTVAGPVRARTELQNVPSRRKELSSGWLPPELHPMSSANAPWNHDAGGYRPPELHSTSIAEAETDRSRQPSRLIPRKPISDPSKASQPTPTIVGSSSDRDETQPLQAQQTTSTANELAEEADVVVQELGLVNMRKKTLTNEATSKGVQPEALEGRKGAEYQKLLKREGSLRERLDEIEHERATVQ